jgi:MYXO-CTERM domain-containing protein
MKRSTGIFVVTIGLLGAGLPALATTVDYTTTGIFSQTGTNVLSTGPSGTLTYSGVPYNCPGVSCVSGQNDTPPTSISLGLFTAAGLGTVIGEGTFTLTIDQTSPSPTTVLSQVDTLSGQLGPGKTGDIDLTFSQTTFTINGVLYALQNLGQNGLPSNVLALSSSKTTLNSQLTAVAVTTGGSGAPEPTFFGLTAAGVFGLLALAVRRKRREA